MYALTHARTRAQDVIFSVVTIEQARSQQVLYRKDFLCSSWPPFNQD